MAKLLKSRYSQDVQSIEFAASFNDTAKDSVTGATKTFGSNFNDVIVFDAIKLPANARVVGGDLLVETAGVGPTTYTVSVGTAGSATAFLAATSLLSAARTALGLTTPRAAAGSNIRIAINSTVANATAGKFRITVLFVIDDRGGEVTGSV
jgi:hypothetical protein